MERANRRSSPRKSKFSLGSSGSAGYDGGFRSDKWQMSTSGVPRSGDGRDEMLMCKQPLSVSLPFIGSAPPALAAAVQAAHTHVVTREQSQKGSRI